MIAFDGEINLQVEGEVEANDTIADKMNNSRLVLGVFSLIGVIISSIIS